ncbi:OmpA family protein [Acidovorax sp. DW039]|uniref:OmpA family protein n=1 Tax=Acidovorax sp. DW039 TaxID=3095606 RepID=UPI0030CCFAA0
MRKHLLLGATAAVILATGCASMDDTQRRTATGAGIGAVAGAVLGSATGGSAGTGAVVGAGVGALGTYIWSQNMERQKREMEQATRGTGIAVTQTPDNQLMLNIPSDISFAVGRSDIQSNFAPVLDQFAAGLRNNPNTDVRIVGHTDSTGSDAVNNPLSVDRAASTRSYLVARGVDGRRIAIDGVGSRYPIASNDTADGRARNRRVEIFMGERAR